MNQQFTVKLSFWTTPIRIYAKSNREAERLALKEFPICDCGCNEKTTVDWSMNNAVLRKVVA